MAKVERRPVSGLDSVSDVRTGEFYERITDGAVFLAVAMLGSVSGCTRGGRLSVAYERYTEEPERHAQMLVLVETGALAVLSPDSDGYSHGEAETGGNVYKEFGLKESEIPEDFVVKASDLRHIAGRVLIDPLPPPQGERVLNGELVDEEHRSRSPEKLGRDDGEAAECLDGAPQPPAVTSGRRKPKQLKG